MAFAFKDRLPRLHLPRMVKVAAGNFRKFALQDFVKNIRAAGYFPGIELRGKLPASVPKVKGLFFHFASRDGMGGYGQTTLGPDRASQVNCVAIGGDKAGRSDS